MNTQEVNTLISHRLDLFAERHGLSKEEVPYINPDLLVDDLTEKQGETGIKEIDPVKMQDLCFRRLLKKWSLMNGEEEVKTTDANIDKLHPNVVRVVSTELMGKIQF